MSNKYNFVHDPSQDLEFPTSYYEKKVSTVMVKLTIQICCGLFLLRSMIWGKR